jgi:hypothetical protein
MHGMGKHSAENYEFLFNKSAGNLQGNIFETLGHKNLKLYRTKTIKSGQVVECEIYPIWNTRNEVRKAKKAVTKKAQKALNNKNAVKALTRKINANFTEKDTFLTLTYRDNFLPTKEQAKKDIRNFIRRARDRFKKYNLPEFKYIYVIEFYNGDGRRTRVHHHVIMSGMNRPGSVMTTEERSALKSLWKLGGITADELRPENGSLEGLARYITKQPANSKHWQGSKNLAEPKVTVSDTKISLRKAERIAHDITNEAPRIFAKPFPDCDFDECIVKRGDFVSGVYIYAKLHKTPQKPPAKKPKSKGGGK